MKLPERSRGPFIGRVRDAPQHDGLKPRCGAGADVLIVEFDDQGLCHDRAQMAAVSARLAELRLGEAVQDAVFITFIHGWNHNAAPGDAALPHLVQVVRRIAAWERRRGEAARPVIGIFVGWRGRSLFGAGLEHLTFWGRKQAGARVAKGAVRELLGRLRQFRSEREAVAPGRTVLVVFGHSLGSRIVYSAIAQSLIEAAATEGDDTVPGFANLVMLVNPAFEAVRYLAVHTLVRERSRLNLPEQPRPVFVCITAVNDWATRYAFPAGMLWARLFENANTKREKTALTRTMGHIDWLRTHTLTLAGEQGADAVVQRRFGRTVLSRVQFGTENPFWTVSASPGVINGHGGIFKPAFQEFLQALVLEHLQDADSAGGVAAIHQQIGSGDEAGSAARQEQGRLGDLVGLA